MAEKEPSLWRCGVPSCEKAYTNLYNLRRHIRHSHFGLNNFQCEVCGRVLSSKQNYREHKYRHTGERPFKCVECGERFRHSSQWSMHRRVHALAVAAQPSISVVKVKFR